MAAWLALGAAPDPKPRPKLPPEMEELVGMSYAAPAELGAAALLRVAESGRIRERELRIGLLEQAFRLAARAGFKLRRRHLPGHPVDTRSGYLDQAYRLRLDALSLQTRAIRGLLPLSKQKARDLFQEAPLPALEPLSCEDPLVPEVDDFYDTAVLVANQCFGGEERRREEHVSWARSLAAAISSPAQVPGAARMVRSLQLAPPQFEVVAAGFTAALEQLSGDDRSFGFHERAALQEVRRLAESLAARHIPAEGLTAALDKYLSRHRSAKRCADNLQAGTPGISAGAAPAGGSPVQGGVKLHPYWESPAARDLLLKGRKLRWGTAGQPVRALSEAERKSAEWGAELTDVLNDMAAWRESAEKSEADYYHQKCILYQVLLELAPPGPSRDRVCREFVGFVSASGLQRESPVEWFFHVPGLLERLRATQGAEPGRLLEALGASGNAALALYSRLETVLPAPLLETPGRD